MVGFRHVTTFASAHPTVMTNIADLSVLDLDGRPMLVSSTHAGGGMVSFFIDDAELPITHVSGKFYGTGYSYLTTPQSLLVDMPGGAVIMTVGMIGGVAIGTPVDAAGKLGGTAPLFDTDLLGEKVVTAGQFQTDSGDFVYAAEQGDLQFSVYRKAADGSLDFVSRSPAGLKSDIPEASIDRILVVDQGPEKMIITLSGLGNFISTHRVTATGEVQGGDFFSAAEGAGFNRPNQLVAVDMDGTTYVIVGSAVASSLSVMQLTDTGFLLPVDHVIDELTTRFQSCSALATATVDGRTFVFAGGADDGVTMFLLRPDGRLMHVETLGDSDGITLADISDIATQVIDGKIALFISSTTERGITQLIVDPGRVGINGQVQSGAATGAATNDLMMAVAGETRSMSGLNGDDTLIAAGSPIHLTGGAGADTFVAAPTEGRITITDFQLGLDRLDLSNLGMIRSIYQVSFTMTANGGLLRMGRLEILVLTADGKPLTSAFLTNEMFPIAHYSMGELLSTMVGTSASDWLEAPRVGATVMGGGGNDTLLGSNTNDTLRGDGGHDSLIGAYGDDSLVGGSGNNRMRGGWGRDTLVGGSGHDIMMGDQDDDVLKAFAGSDRMFGGAGNDYLHGGVGNDTLLGDSGNDTLIGYSGDDTLAGGSGDDMLLDYFGTNRILGGGGNDTLRSGGGADYLSGSTGQDVMFAGGGTDSVDGGSGDDVIRAGSGNDSVRAGGGNDLAYGNTGDDLIDGATGFDTLIGGSGNDTLSGAGGRDSLNGETGNDSLDGGDREDLLRGGPGRDTLNGSNGHDTLYGGGDHDLLMGGNGNDLLFGDLGMDTLLGGAGTDRLIGGDADDHLDGGGGHDHLAGGHGADTLFGGASNDTMDGGDGADVMWGGSGSDQLQGGSFDDWLSGGLGADTLTGGTGRDIFAWLGGDESKSFAPDLVRDFTPGQDRLDLAALHLHYLGTSDFDGLPGALRYEHSGDQTLVLADLDGNGLAELTIRLLGTHHLTGNDFIL